MKIVLCLIVLTHGFNAAMAQTMQTNSVALKPYLELVYSNGQVARVNDGDTLLSLQDAPLLSACVKVITEADEIQNVTSADAIFIIENEQPNIEATRGCLNENQLRLLSKLKLSDGDVLMFRNVKAKVNGQTRSTAPLHIGKGKQE